MPTYWDSFLTKYKDYRLTDNLNVLLHAFWCYTHYEDKECDKLMEQLK